MNKIFSRFKRNEEGQSMVEFALILLPLTFLLLGIVEFGWIFNGQITLTSSAREGARVAAVTNDVSKIEQAVINHTSGSALNIINVDPIWPDSSSSNYDPDSAEVEVFVTATINPIVNLFVGSNPVELDGAATMRLEYKP